MNKSKPCSVCLPLLHCLQTNFIRNWWVNINSARNWFCGFRFGLVLMNDWQTSWSITPNRRQWAVVVRYGMRRATGASLSSWFLKAAGLSCSTTTAGSWFQSPTVLAASELRSPDKDVPIALNLYRWFALVLLSAATKPIWSGPTATCPVTTLYNKASHHGHMNVICDAPLLWKIPSF